MVADALRGIISQQLVPTSDGKGRVVSLEVLVVTPAISNLIRNNEIVRMQDVIQTSRDRGMFTLDDHLALLVKRGVIEREVALAFCLDPRLLESRLR